MKGVLVNTVNKKLLFLHIADVLRKETQPSD